MSAAVFCLRAFRMPSRPEAAVAAPAPGYRFSASEPALFESVARSSLLTFVPASRDAIARLLTGALFATYLSAWTTGWSGGPWPEHRLWLDLAVSAAAALLVLKARARVALLPLAANYFHFAIRLGWITAPSSALEWGMASVSTGFGLLVASLFATWRIQGSKGVADLRQRSRHRMGRSVAR